MTLDDFLTLTLPQRVAWLHHETGPKGFLSHDNFAKALGGTSRQVIISWEKDGVEPQAESREKLAAFSGFPAWAFSRREAEAPAAWSLLRRLDALQVGVAELLDGQREVLRLARGGGEQSQAEDGPMPS